MPLDQEIVQRSQLTLTPASPSRWPRFRPGTITAARPLGLVTPMELIMTTLKLLSASTALVLAFALASPTASFARGRGGIAGGGGGHGAAVGGGGGRMGGPVVGGGSVGRGGGANFAVPAAPGRIGGSGSTTAFNAGRGWNGGGWHHRGWWPGAAFVPGAALGGSYAYAAGPDY